jgi:nucleoside-diphosphate-sugar epimerase
VVPRTEEEGVKTKYFVTGHRGVIGDAVMRRLSPLLDYGDSILVLGEDVRSFTLTHEPLDTIFHFAAKCDREDIVGNSALVVDIIIRGTQRVIEQARMSGAKLVFASTLFSVDDFGEDYPEINYDLAKFIAENDVRRSGLPHAILKIPHVYADEEPETRIVSLVRAGRYSEVEDDEVTLIHADDLALELLSRIDDVDSGDFYFGSARTYTKAELVMKFRDTGRRD